MQSKAILREHLKHFCFRALMLRIPDLHCISIQLKWDTKSDTLDTWLCSSKKKKFMLEKDSWSESAARSQKLDKHRLRISFSYSKRSERQLSRNSLSTRSVTLANVWAFGASLTPMHLYNFSKEVSAFRKWPWNQYTRKSHSWKKKLLLGLQGCMFWRWRL